MLLQRGCGNRYFHIFAYIMYLSHSTMAGNSDILTYLHILAQTDLCLAHALFQPLFSPRIAGGGHLQRGTLKANRPFSTTNFLLPIASKVYDWHGHGLRLSHATLLLTLQKLYIQKRNELNCIELLTYIKMGTTTACSAFLRWISKCPLPGKYRSEASARGMRLPQNSKLTVLRSQTLKVRSQILTEGSIAFCLNSYEFYNQVFQSLTFYSDF